MASSQDSWQDETVKPEPETSFLIKKEGQEKYGVVRDQDGKPYDHEVHKKGYPKLS